MDDGGLPPRGAGAPRREPVRFTEGVTREILARVSAGESLSSIERDPHMPSRTGIWEWRQAHPEFDRALSRAQRLARLARRRMDRLRDGGTLTRPKPFDLRQSTYTPELGERICERLAGGESLIAICHDPDMPHPGTVYKWVRRIPEFQEMYVDARQFQGDYLFDEVREIALWATPPTVWVARARIDANKWQAARLSPNKYCERMLTEEALAREQPMVVVVRKFTDHPDQTPEEREALRRGKVVWSTAPGIEPGDLMPEE